MRLYKSERPCEPDTMTTIYEEICAKIDSENKLGLKIKVKTLFVGICELRLRWKLDSSI